MLNVLPDRMKNAVEKAKDIIDKLTLTEKLGQLTQFGTSIYNDEINYFLDHYEEGKIGTYLSVSGAKVINMLQKECEEKFPTKIPLLFADDVIHGYRTTLPTPLAQSCSWNPELAKKGAEVAAKEAYVAGLRWTFSPMVDIARDPRWGRIVEGYGEDTYLCSKFSEAMVKGYQGDEIGEKYHVLSCLKHFIGYGAGVGGRDYNEVEMSYQTLYDVYLPPFQAGINAGAATVMPSFNSLNGVPVTGSKYLLTTILREVCGFDGFTVSDFNAIPELFIQGYAEDWKDTVYKGFDAGVDILMTGDLYNEYIPKLIQEGTLKEEDIDDALLRVITLKILLGLFENPYGDEQEEETVFFCDEHVNVSREMGRDCIVLLENNGVLPLQKQKRVSLIGPLADDKEHVLGTWACKKDPSKTVSVLEGLKKADVDVTYAKGCDIFEGDEEEIKHAVQIAKESDIVILVLGESHDMSGEAKSRAHLTLPEIQLKLLDAVIETNIPVVLLISAGRPIVVEDYKKKVAALAYTWQLGTAMGDAVADILTGKYDANGRLSVTVPKCVGQVPLYYNHSNTGKPYRGVFWAETGYMDETPKPSYPFGYGLSYTDFEITTLSLSNDSMKRDGSIDITCQVANKGKRDGQTVVQLYVRDLVGSCVRPVKELKGFEKITLKAGETCAVRFTLDASTLAFHNEKLEKVIEPGQFRLWVGQHSNDEELSAQFSVEI